MGAVYRVGSVYGTEYFNTARDADRCKPGGEEPESVERLDAADECNRLQRDVDDTERTINALRLLLSDLRDVCPADILEGTEAGRRANKFVEDNPLSPAGSDDREGQRSYGV